jgi:hypothetical protein
VIATEGQEMHLAGLLITNESRGDGREHTPVRLGVSLRNQADAGRAVPPRSENPDLGHPDFWCGRGTTLREVSELAS